MIFASIVFNFSYASAKSRELLDVFGGFGKYGISWVGWVAAFGYLVCAYGVVRKAIQRNPISSLDLFLLAWFPIEILLSNLSGRNFSHYYISWALAVAVYGAAVWGVEWLTGKASAFAMPDARERLLRFNATRSGRSPLATPARAVVTSALCIQMSRVEFLHRRNLVWGAVFVLALFLLAAIPSSAKRYGETISRLISGQTIEYADPLAEYIRQNTRQDELVLTWYPETTLNFLAGRTSPVKYVYYPLFLEGTLPAGAEENYLEGLTSRRPGMIVDCSRAVDAIPSLNPAAREDQFSRPGIKKKMYIQPGMEEIFSFVAENYHLETSVEGCYIFRLNSE